MDVLAEHEILLGTYEAFVLGYKPTKDHELLASFANHAHASSVRSLAAGDKFLISSGSDENVKVFNLRNRTEHGDLTHADCAINTMVFYDNRHVITGSEDGKICVLKTKTWEVEKTLLKHSAGVVDIAIHPSGKMALSVGKDRKLVTWNLVKGRSAFVTNIKEIASLVRWSPDGQYYAVGFYKRIDVYSVASGDVEFTIKINGRSNDVVFLDDATLVVAGEMPQIHVYSLVTKQIVHKFDAHETRVRCMAVLRSSSTDRCCLVTSSSDGKVKVWKVGKESESDFQIQEEACADTKCRITCMVVHKVPPVTQATSDIAPEVVQALVSDVKKVKTKRIRIQEPEEEKMKTRKKK